MRASQMNGRLRTHFSDVFIDSLYPQLKERGAKVADAPDDDEDVIVEPAPEPPAGPATP